MVKVDLRGVHYSPKRVKSKKTGKIMVYDYFYAWRGGPKLKGKPGSPEFLESYQNAHKNIKGVPVSNLSYLISLYKKSPKYEKIGHHTKRSYDRHLDEIEKEFGAMPIAVIMDHRSRGIFADWHTKGVTRPRAANLGLSVLQTLLNWSTDKGALEKHHTNGIERHEEGNRAGIDWTDEQIDRIGLLPPQIAHACYLALWTGQRQGDLLSLTWAHVHSDHILLTTSKSRHKVQVVIYISPALRRVLDDIPRGQSSYILNGARGYAWGSGFGGALRKALPEAGITGVTFHDLRSTFENRLWESGCTTAEAYSITGRTMKGSAKSYFSRTKELSKAAMLKLEGTFGEQANTKIYTKISVIRPGE